MKEVPSIAKWLLAFFILILSFICGFIYYIHEDMREKEIGGTEHVYILQDVEPKNTCLPDK